MQIARATFQDSRDMAFQKEQSQLEAVQRRRDQTAKALSALYTQCVDDLRDEGRRVALWEKQLGVAPGDSQRDAGESAPRGPVFYFGVSIRRINESQTH